MQRKKIFSHSAHEGRKDLAGEVKYGDSGQIICLILFLCIWIPDSFVFKISTFLAAHIPWYIRTPISLILFLLAIMLAYRGLKIVFGEIREIPAVIEKDVFKIVRHPIYLASQLFYLGMIFSTLSILSFGLWVFIFLFHNHLASQEEKKCTEIYGQDYLSYKARVGKWIPRLKKS